MLLLLLLLFRKKDLGCHHRGYGVHWKKHGIDLNFVVDGDIVVDLGHILRPERAAEVEEQSTADEREVVEEGFVEVKAYANVPLKWVVEDDTGLEYYCTPSCWE